MTVRPFDWRDIPALHRFRNRGLFLDSIRLLTQGPKLIPFWALFSPFAAATGIYTYHSKVNGSTGRLLGQVGHRAGASFARLSFIAPAKAIESPALQELMERLAAEIGERGAMHLIADVDELDDAYEALRRAGLAIYARQRIWRLSGEPACPALDQPWRPGRTSDLIGARSLYCNLVPGLVQQVEPAPSRHLRGMVYRQRGDVLGYAELRSGPAGVWLQPFIHPDLEHVPDRLADLVCQLRSRRSRPVYFCIRSYQSWLESALEDLGAEPGPRMAVMVRHLAIAKKAVRAYALPALERGHPEVTAPIVRRTVNTYDTTSDN